MAALNPVQQEIIIQPAAPQWDRNQDADSRIYALVVLGNVLQGLGIASGILFVYCILKVSPLFLFAEIISAILWAVGEELKLARLWPDGAIHIPHLSNNGFIPNQAIGLPKRGQNCCFNAAIQIALASDGVNRLLARHPDQHPLKQIYNRIEQAREAHQLIASQADTQLVRGSIGLFSNGQISAHSWQQEDSGEILNHLLNQLTEQTPGAEHSYSRSYIEGADDRGYGNPLPLTRLILEPAAYLEQLRLGQIPAEASTTVRFLGCLMRPFFSDTQILHGQARPVRRIFSSLPDELFIQLSRTVNERNGQQIRLKKINDPLPIPPSFELPRINFQNAAPDAPNQFQADAFVIHNGTSMRTGHYVAYKRTYAAETGYTWWKINDSRVEPLSTKEAEEALKSAYIVHYTRHPRI